MSPLRTIESDFIAEMKTKYQDDADMLRVLSYYDDAQARLSGKSFFVERQAFVHRMALGAFAEAVKVYRQRAAYHRAQRKIWQRRCRAVFRLAHGRLPTVAELEAMVTKDWKQPPAADSA